jgi:hypothetical protein
MADERDRDGERYRGRKRKREQLLEWKRGTSQQ